MVALAILAGAPAANAAYAGGNCNPAAETWGYGYYNGLPSIFYCQPFSPAFGYWVWMGYSGGGPGPRPMRGEA